jgi:hypothetical protein
VSAKKFRYDADRLNFQPVDKFLVYADRSTLVPLFRQILKDDSFENVSFNVAIIEFI